MSTSNTLFKDFNSQSLSDWEAKIVKDLKGKKLEELEKLSVDGIKIQPHYHKDNSPEAVTLSSERVKNDWKINHVITVGSNLKEANKIALNGLKYGANSLTFVGRITNLNELLDGIMIHIIDLHFEAHNPIEAAEELKEYCNTHSISFHELTGSIAGTNSVLDKELFELLLPTNLKCIRLNASRYENNVISFGNCLAEYNHLIGLLNDQHSEKEIINKCFFSLDIHQEYFTEVAKIRALKLMSSKINEEYGYPFSTPVYATVSTKQWQKTDEENNLLRASSSASAAIIGGCDMLYIPPFKDGAYRLSTNIQLLLKEESYLDQVKDPSSGAYFIEYLTNQIIQESWKKFQQID